MKRNLAIPKQSSFISEEEREEAAQIIVRTLLKKNVFLEDIQQLSGKSVIEIKKIAQELNCEVKEYSANEKEKWHE